MNTLTRIEMITRARSLPRRSHHRLRIEGRLYELTHDELSPLPQLEGRRKRSSAYQRFLALHPLWMALAIVVLNIGSVVAGLLLGWWL